jgi:E3 ubiquitin-protein ligase ZNF598
MATAITTEESSTPSQRRPDGQRVGRGRGGRGRGGAGASEMPSDGNSKRQEGTGRVRGRGGSRGGHGRMNSNTMTASDLQTRFALQKTSGGQIEQAPGVADQAAPGGPDAEAEVCFICASTVVHNSVAPCNHRTCHICALRMRALYKTKDCAHCRVSFFPIPFPPPPCRD